MRHEPGDDDAAAGSPSGLCDYVWTELSRGTEPWDARIKGVRFMLSPSRLVFECCGALLSGKSVQA